MAAITPASAATGVDGFTILYAAEGNTAHHCEVIGSDSLGNEGVICADILTGTTSTNYWSKGRMELICTKGGVAEQCAQVDAWGEWSNGAGADDPFGGWYCGHQFGACSTGRNYVTSPFPLYYSSASGCSSEPNTTFDVWMVVTQGTKIELPGSGKWVTLTSNYSGGHYWVCA